MALYLKEKATSDQKHNFSLTYIIFTFEGIINYHTVELYPLKFQPVFKQKIWGGNKLRTELNKDFTEDNVGESWEISDVEDGQTVVVEGELKGKNLRALISEFKGDFLGRKVLEKFGNEFPLLIKFIDAKTPLSIQVHPSDEVARTRHNSFGKNEMWYIMQADKDAELIVGFYKAVNKDEYKQHLEKSTILDILNTEKVAAGDAFYIPTGRVHAIGAGVLLAEIQQTSDITYRIFDYDRVDSKTGEKRELHNDLALDVIDFQLQENYKTTYNLVENTSAKLVRSPYFKTNIIALNGELNKDYSSLDSFVIYMCVEGDAELIYSRKHYSLKKGETILLPASIDEISLKGSARLLEVSI